MQHGNNPKKPGRVTAHTHTLSLSIYIYILFWVLGNILNGRF
jgi:hypothetical protein